MKQYFENVNGNKCLFYLIIGMQVVSSYVGNGEYEFWNTFKTCLILWVFYTMGYNSLDRELEIKLNKALKEIKADATPQA